MAVIQQFKKLFAFLVTHNVQIAANEFGIMKRSDTVSVWPSQG